MKLPDSFVLGTATAAYQIEGAWAEDGKGPSIWDTFAHRRGTIWQEQDGDVAVDHYHRYREDIALMKALGASAYRFSIAWSRVLPNGTGRVNGAGLSFYDRLVDELLEQGIEPYVTLFHWDLPQNLQDRRGFLARESADWFAEYAQVVATALGDRVSRWMTINEPWVHTLNGYLIGDHAPGMRNPWAFLKAGYHLLLAHARGYEALKAARGNAEVGLALSMMPVHAGSDSPGDRRAAQLADQFVRGIFLDPLFKGGYPHEIWKRLRLFRPQVRERDLELIKGSYDWIGVNHYTRVFAIRRWFIPFVQFWLMDHARSTGRRRREAQFTSMGWEVYPRGIYEVLTTFREEYGNPPVYITENGAAFEDRVEGGAIHDEERTRFLKSYLEMALRAREEGADLRGIFVWTLMDNFEWAFGFSKRFGLVHVDFPTGRRTIKDSGRWFADLARSRRIPSSPTTKAP